MEGCYMPAKYLYWRGHSLWCRFPLPGYPRLFPLGIKTTGTAADRRRCEKEGEELLAELRTRAKAGTLLIENADKEEAPKDYKFWRLIGRYWYYHLRFQRSGRNERYHLMHSLKKFGYKYAKSITREDVELWRQEMVKNGSSINAVNNRYAYLKAVYSWSNNESTAEMRIGCDPTRGLEKLPGGRIRTFVLTREKFERNYQYLKTGEKYLEKPNKHCSPYKVPPTPRFALFYLALWETGRRPIEVSRYTWEMCNEINVDGRVIHRIAVPPELNKNDRFNNVVISDRLWREISQLGYRHGLIFRNQEGNRWKHWSRHKRKLEKKFGQDCGWIRDCRRGMITHKVETCGRDPMHVQMQSGHSTKSVFERYRIGDLRNQAAVMDEPISPFKKCI